MIQRLFPICTAALIAISISGFTAGCASPEVAPTGAETPTTYDVQGRVVDHLAGEGSILVEHAPIEGYMPGMAMAFRARKPARVKSLQSGDAIQFRYHVAPDSTWIDEIERLSDAALAEHPSREDAPQRVAPSARSIYHLDASWTTQDDRRIQLADLRGRPVILAMVFTHCSYACPLIVRDMKTVTANLALGLQQDVQHVLVSIDPARDTPAALARFAEAHHLPAGQWTLVRGAAADVRTLAALLGVRYKPDGDGQFAHTNLITILNAEGEIVHQQEGLGADPARTVETLRQVVRPAS